VKPTTSRRLAAIAVGLALAAAAALFGTALWRLHLPYVNTFLGLALGCLTLAGLALLTWKVVSALLFKVGRRLAFSYFLIGVLPIPMVMLLLGVVAYLLASFFIGHLYRDALRSLEADVAAATRARAVAYLVDGRPPAHAAPPQAGETPGMVFAYYRNGQRVAGDPRLPATWPTWANATAGTATGDTATAATAVADPAAPNAAGSNAAAPSAAKSNAATPNAAASQAAASQAGSPRSAGTHAPASNAAANGAASRAAAAPSGAAPGARSGGAAAANGANPSPGIGGASAGMAAAPSGAPSGAAAGTGPEEGAPSPGSPTSPGSSATSAAEAAPAAPRFFAGADHGPTLAAAVAGGSGRGVVGLYTGDLELEISRRSGVWVEIDRPGDPVDEMQVKLGTRELPHLIFHRTRNLGEAQKFFKRQSLGEGLWDRQLLWWGQAGGPLLDLATGREVDRRLLVQLNGTPRLIKTHLFSANGEVDAASWGALLGLAVLLANVYAAAAIMAVFMIVGLSRAVNRLSRATDAVRRGDFGARIPVERRDQVGQLQRDFNEMAVNLQMLVAASAQKELLEKELALARDLQNSLLPSNLPNGEGVEFATLFEPSAAIGGDYFDVLRLSRRELAVIVADVSGHGLSTGLRMAMLKASLLILIEQTRDPEELLRRLDKVVRANEESRYFVTATLAIFDIQIGKLSLTNAGHPPTYLVRGHDVEEILLPSSPLGGLGQRYQHRELQLERGDAVVWLSDGLFEGVNADGEPFGYDRVLEALEGRAGPAPAERPGRGRGGAGANAANAANAASTARAARTADTSATGVRDRLLTAVSAFVGSEPPSDDRTLVVLRWGGPLATAAAPAEEAAVGAAAR
jgi:HAMP domain-containing protein